MTRIEELKKTRDHLTTAREALASSMRCAVLSRKRRAETERIERATLELIADVEEELERRAAAA